MIECKSALDCREIKNLDSLAQLNAELLKEAREGNGGKAYFFEKFGDLYDGRNPLRAVCIGWEEENPNKPQSLDYLSQFIIQGDFQTEYARTHLGINLGSFNSNGLAELVVAQGRNWNRFGGIISRKTLLGSTYVHRDEGRPFVNNTHKQISTADELLKISFLEPNGLYLAIYNCVPNKEEIDFFQNKGKRTF